MNEKIKENNGNFSLLEIKFLKKESITPKKKYVLVQKNL